MTTFNELGPGLEQPSSRPPEEDGRLLKIKKLKAKLINEEHRLVLMKKIRQSQTRPIAAQNQTNNNINNNSIINSNAATANQSPSGALNHNSSSHHQHPSSSSNNSSSNSSNSHVKKLRPSHLLHQNSPMALQKSHQSGLAAAAAAAAATANLQASGTSSSLNQTPAHAHQRPKVNTLWNPPQQARHPTPAGLAPAHVGNLSRPPITTPPNVVQAMMGSLAGQQSLFMNQINAATAAAAATTRRTQQQSATQQQTSSFSSPSFNKSQAAQMLLQKRSSFKPSIQKQLEQTLIQQQLQQHQQTQQQKHGQSSGLGSYSTPNLNKRSAVGITSPHVGNLSRQPITTPPNVVQDMRGGLSGQQSLLMNSNSLSTSTGSSSRRSQQHLQLHQQSQLTSPATTFNKSQAAQLLLQKRTAAKSAIQKQLEQTLMQLPQKNIQVGIDFVPNANNIEFVYYVGLEGCVDYLTNTKNPLDIQPLEKPFECSTCGTDFTPAWSWKRSNAVCENCVSNHVKKSIKNSQASRIKSVLIKAAKQEQEMEQRIMAEAATVVSTASPTTSTSQQHSLLQPTSHHLQQPQHHTNLHHQSPQSNQPQQQPQRSTPQAWPRMNASPVIANTNRSTHVQPAVAPPPNPLAGLQPAALASLLQMNPQLSTLASLMTANNSNTNNTNQFAQVAALLMNQLTMNLTGNWKR